MKSTIEQIERVAPLTFEEYQVMIDNSGADCPEILAKMLTVEQYRIYVIEQLTINLKEIVTSAPVNMSFLDWMETKKQTGNTCQYDGNGVIEIRNDKASLTIDESTTEVPANEIIKLEIKLYDWLKENGDLRILDY
jgi:hypothetical protein